MTFIRRIIKIGLPASVIGVLPPGLLGQIPEGPATSFMPSFLQGNQASQIAGQPVSVTPAQPTIPESPFSYGPLVLEPDLAYNLTYETGIQVAPGQAADVTCQSLSAAMVLQGGTIWNLAYIPKWVRYSSSLFQDTVDQSAKLGTNLTYEDWAFQVAQAYSKSADPLIETGRQTGQQSYGTDFKGLYGSGAAQQLSLEVDFDQNILFATLSPSTYNWTNADWVHYLITPQLDFAAGSGFGYTHEDPGIDSAYLEPQAKIVWKPSVKVTLDVQAGLEERRYYTADRETSQTPSFSANFTYEPVETTKLTATGNRGLGSSLFADLVTVSTTFDLQISQRLLTYFYLSLEGSTAKINYISTESALSTVRGDTTDSAQASLSTVIFRRITIGLSASRVRNASSQSGFAFTSGQYGIQAALKY